ncbi:hypothetical protein V5799_027147 [Amblyomma americanum]|uniref:Fibronectin type-III domain-containing protein n=1 Tax=Amblyomma americanum TaxID=6943 RepID=A0AAQ4DGJ6_AMBAM
MKYILLIVLLDAVTALISNHCPFTGDVIPNQFRCQDDRKYIPLTKVCDGDEDCSRSRNYDRYSWSRTAQDEDPNICAKDFLWQTMDLSSETNPNGSITVSWAWRHGHSPSIYNLAGYYMIGRSEQHNFEVTLPPTHTWYTPNCMLVHTEYEISLWPFYKRRSGDLSSDELRRHMAGSDHPRYLSLVQLGKVGKATMHKVRTPASAPSAVAEILPLLAKDEEGHAAGQLVVQIRGPERWNSQPAGFHLRWKQAGAEETAEKDFELPRLAYDRYRKGTDLNATLSLKPGRQYILHASARGLGGRGEILAGPETSTIVEIPPVVPVDLVVEVVDPTKLILSWRVGSPAKKFAVAFIRRRSLEQKCVEEMSKLDFSSELSVTPSCTDSDGKEIILQVGGSDEESSAYTLPVFELTPFSEYEVRVKACGASVCSQDMGVVFRTPPLEISSPVFTTVLSNNTSSIYLQWDCELSQEAPGMNIEFELVVKTNASYRIIRTANSSIGINDLLSGTQYEVQVRTSLEYVPGKTEYGPAAKAIVSTWPIVPLAPTLSTESFQTAPDVVVVFGEFVNSTVSYVEVSADNGEWLRCGISPDCKIVTLEGWTPKQTKGYAIISGLEPYRKYELSVRGCNQNGCGNVATTSIMTAMSEVILVATLSLY